MKTPLILSIAVFFALELSTQVSPINLYYYKAIAQSKNTKTSNISWTNFSVQSSFRYLPEKVHDQQVIRVNRAGTGFDDIYYIENKGNSTYHSVTQTRPVNTIMRRGADSFNPNNASTMGEAVFMGVSSMISNWFL